MQFPKWYHAIGYILFNTIIFLSEYIINMIITLKLPIKEVILGGFEKIVKSQIMFSRPEIPTFGGGGGGFVFRRKFLLDLLFRL